MLYFSRFESPVKRYRLLEILDKAQWVCVLASDFDFFLEMIIIKKPLEQQSTRKRHFNISSDFSEIKGNSFVNMLL